MVKRRERAEILAETLVRLSLEPKGRTLGDRIKDYETPESRALAMPDWEELKRKAWESFERYNARLT